MKKMNVIKKILCLTLACGLLIGCSKKEPIDCPFTDLGWDTTPEQLINAKGESADPYDSTYGGITYTYETDYVDKTGIIKYMYDEDEELMSVAWAYSSMDADELQTVYNDILEETEEIYGKSDYDTNEATNYGKAWQMDEGHIILSVMLTESNKALQVAYINPRNEEKKDGE